MIHQLKTTLGFFSDIASGDKSFEVRLNDRDYRTGDFLALNELDEDVGFETGRCLLVEVTYILNDKRFCKQDHVVMGIRPCAIGRAKDRDVFCDRNFLAAQIYGEKRVVEGAT